MLITREAASDRALPSEALPLNKDNANALASLDALPFSGQSIKSPRRAMVAMLNALDIAQQKMVAAMRVANSSVAKDGIFEAFTRFECAIEILHSSYFSSNNRFHQLTETERFQYFVLAVFHQLDVFCKGILISYVQPGFHAEQITEIEVNVVTQIRSLLDFEGGKAHSSGQNAVFAECPLVCAPESIQRTLLGFEDAHECLSLDLKSLFKIQADWLFQVLALRRNTSTDRFILSCLLNGEMTGLSWRNITRSKIGSILHLYIENSNYLRMQSSKESFEIYMRRIAWRIENFFNERGWPVVLHIRNESEIVVLVQAVGDAHLCNIMARDLQRRLERRAELSPGVTMFSAVSIGHIDASEYPLLGLSELLIRAASAVDEVRSGARGKVFKYNYSLDEKYHSAAISLGMLWEAAQARKFKAYLQPKVDLETLEPVGYEALARLEISGDKVIGPGAFLHGLRDPSLSQAITKQIVMDVIAAVQLFREQAFDFGHIAINLGSNQLMDRVIPDFLMSVVEAGRINLDDIEIEVTEDTALHNEGFNPQIQIRRLADFGFRISLDDFGTGYASFRHLTQIPFDTLKIDGTFVKGMLTNNGDRAVVKAIVSVARKMNKNVVAEWVENEEQLLTLRKLGCRVGQGYLFGEAVSPQDIISARK